MSTVDGSRTEPTPSGAVVPPAPRPWWDRRKGPQLVIPPKGALAKTGDVDFIDDYYGGVFAQVLRARLRWVLGALPRPCDRVLEVGFGSGILQYSLAGAASWRAGLDVHDDAAEVRDRLAVDGVAAQLMKASGTALPFRDDSFDAVVLVSVLEFVPDPDVCLAEAERVVRPGGRIVAIIPRRLQWADALFKRLSGVDPESDFQGGRERVAEALTRREGRVRRQLRPRGLPRFGAPYELVLVPGTAGRPPA